MCGPGQRGVEKQATVLAPKPVAGPLSAPVPNTKLGTSAVAMPRSDGEIKAVLEAASEALPAAIEGIKDLLARDTQAQVVANKVRTELLVALGLTNSLTTKGDIRKALQRLGIPVPSEFQDGRKGPRKKRK